MAFVLTYNQHSRKGLFFIGRCKAGKLREFSGFFYIMFYQMWKDKCVIRRL